MVQIRCGAISARALASPTGCCYEGLGLVNTGKESHGQERFVKIYGIHRWLYDQQHSGLWHDH